MLAAAIKMEEYWVFIYTWTFFSLATRNEETSEESQEDENPDIWEQQQMRKAVKITKVIIFCTIYINFLCLL